MTSTAPPPHATRQAVDNLLRETVAAQFDPGWGSAFWMNRAARLGMDGLHDIQTLADLRALGTIEPHEIAACPLDAFVPRSVAENLKHYLLAQTGGTTGPGTWTVFEPGRFHEAFVEPFLTAAQAVGFPSGERWLFVGPSGPHIIGRAARAIAKGVGSPEPFSIDFDPRWVRRIGGSEFARQRYIAHLVEQCMGVLDRTPIGVLFITPPLGIALADEMTTAQRQVIRGLHYGGMRLTREMRTQLEIRFPNAVHLSGYGNTLLGCAPELCATMAHGPAYYPFGQRTRYMLLDDLGRPVDVGETGRICATRLDPDYFFCNLLERDRATRVCLPVNAPAGFSQDGLLDPHTPQPERFPLASGLY